MQARELLLFHYASTTRWEQQQKQLSLSLPLCAPLSHVCFLTLSTQTFVFSLLFDYHFISLSLLKLQNTSLFPLIFFLWPIPIPFHPAKRESLEEEQNLSPFPHFSCLPQTHRAQCYQPLKKSSDKIISWLPWSYCFWATFEVRQRHENDMTLWLYHTLKISYLWAVIPDQESSRTVKPLLSSTHSSMKKRKRRKT